MSNNTNPFDFSIPKNIIGLLGNITAISLFISPIFMIISICKREMKAKDIAYSLMLMSILNCLSWLSFGILEKDIFMILGNSIGYILNLIYFSIFLFFRFEENRPIFILLTFVLFVVTGFLWVGLSFLIKNKILSKYIAMTFNILLFASPGQKLVIIKFFNFLYFKD